MSSEPQSCPRCGAALQRRLRDLECPSCGYFSVAERKSAGAGVTSVAAPSLDHAAAAPARSGHIRGQLMRLDEPLPRSPLAGLKLALLIGGGLVTVAGTLALVLASPANQPGSQVLGPVLISSLIQLSLMAAALYVDWPAAKLAGAGLALAFAALDLVFNLPAWNKLSGLAQLVHVANAIVLVLLALLLLAEWRHENSPAD